MCRFVKKCTRCDVVSNQGEERVADQLCIGLADSEIQEDLLKDPNQDMSVEETIRFVEVGASGKRSAVSMTTPTSTNGIDNDEGNQAISSAYRRQQRRPPSRPGQGPGKATPPGHTPQREPDYPNPRATSTRGTEPATTTSSQSRAPQTRHMQLLRTPGTRRARAYCPQMHPLPSIWHNLLLLRPPKPHRPDVLVDGHRTRECDLRAGRHYDRGDPQSPDVESTNPTLDPDEVPTSIPPRSHHCGS